MERRRASWEARRQRAERSERCRGGGGEGTELRRQAGRFVPEVSRGSLSKPWLGFRGAFSLCFFLWELCVFCETIILTAPVFSLLCPLPAHSHQARAAFNRQHAGRLSPCRTVLQPCTRRVLQHRVAPRGTLIAWRKALRQGMLRCYALYCVATCFDAWVILVDLPMRQHAAMRCDATCCAALPRKVLLTPVAVPLRHCRATDWVFPCHRIPRAQPRGTPVHAAAVLCALQPRYVASALTERPVRDGGD